MGLSTQRHSYGRLLSMAIYKELPVLDVHSGRAQSQGTGWDAEKLGSAQSRSTEPTMSAHGPVALGEVPRHQQARPLAPSRAREILAERKPPWLKIRPPSGDSYTQIKGLLRQRNLHTVCEEAHCPNVAECWASGTATFMLGGDICTRACRFCAIKTARIPPPLDPDEPEKIAQSIATLGLHYVVLTSVDRDDLEDQASSHFARAVAEIKRLDQKVLIETLMPDFRGDQVAVSRIVAAGVDVYAHNVETVARLQYRVRDPRANYLQSLQSLAHAKAVGRQLVSEGARKIPLYTKSSLMLGLGESEDELKAAFVDLRRFGVDILTLGQYLRPTLEHLPVERFYSPEEFDRLAELARGYGFIYVASGPMVRSSYRAGELFIKGLISGVAGTQ